MDFVRVIIFTLAGFCFVRVVQLCIVDIAAYSRFCIGRKHVLILNGDCLALLIVDCCRIHSLKVNFKTAISRFVKFEICVSRKLCVTCKHFDAVFDIPQCFLISRVIFDIEGLQIRDILGNDNFQLVVYSIVCAVIGILAVTKIAILVFFTVLNKFRHIRLVVVNHDGKYVIASKFLYAIVIIIIVIPAFSRVRCCTRNNQLSRSFILLNFKNIMGLCINNVLRVVRATSLSKAIDTLRQAINRNFTIIVRSGCDTLITSIIFAAFGLAGNFNPTVVAPFFQFEAKASQSGCRCICTAGLALFMKRNTSVGGFVLRENLNIIQPVRARIVCHRNRNQKSRSSLSNACGNIGFDNCIHTNGKRNLCSTRSRIACFTCYSCKQVTLFF